MGAYSSFDILFSKIDAFTLEKVLASKNFLRKTSKSMLKSLEIIILSARLTSFGTTSKS